ncbi:hypothetical protein [Kitasatospora sp. NPDC088134]|uniref:hypothetical protein n=1 Tax=Kitasatospora sp. NPDC088134 TaxID=3364071 RepID=UPI0038268F2A
MPTLAKRLSGHLLDLLADGAIDLAMVVACPEHPYDNDQFDLHRLTGDPALMALPQTRRPARRRSTLNLSTHTDATCRAATVRSRFVPSIRGGPVSGQTGADPAPGRTFRHGVLAAAVALPLSLLLGACMNGPDPNEPLPVMAKSEAETRARTMTEYMAQSAGITLDSDGATPFFSNCEGRNGEVVEDGRYTLAYDVTSPLSRTQQLEAIRKIKAGLEKDGFTITDYRETVHDQPDVLLYARHDEGRHFIDVSSGAAIDRLILTVATRCLMPS